MIRSSRRRAAALTGLSATAVLLATLGCNTTPSLAIALRSPHDPTLRDGVDAFVFSVLDSAGDLEALRRFTDLQSTLTLDHVPYGSGLVFALDGLYAGQTPILSGRSCPVDILSGDHLPAVSMFVARIGSFVAAATPPVDSLAAPFGIVRADGGVLLAGGDAGPTTASVALYDPRTGDWSAAPPLPAARAAPALAVLSNGDVLIVGGAANGAAVSEVDLFQSASAIRAVADQPAFALVDAAATALPQGGALVAGGRASTGTTGAAWRFDGTTFAITGALSTPRSAHTLSAVGQGGFAAAFAIGGNDASDAPLGTIELYDPRASSAGSFSLQAAALASPRARHTATVLASGQILVVGGAAGPNSALDTAELFDPLHATVTPAGTLAQPRADHLATPLPDGRVLITGGRDAAGQPLASAEIYDPAINNFTAAQPMASPRAGHVAVPLCDGTVLIAGGGAGAELYSPRR